MSDLEDLDDDDDLDDAGDDELGAALGLRPAQQTPHAAAKPRFFCAGAKRTDERTGKKWCKFKALYRWLGPCPTDEVEIKRLGGVGVGCGYPFACLEKTKGKNSSRRITLDDATMDAVKELVYYPTRIAELDKVLGGGLVRDRSLLLGAPKGAGKTTLCLQVCDGFAQGALKAYFASGEMTQHAVLDYAKRLGIRNKNIALFGDPEGLDTENLFEDVIEFGAQLLVIDSAQVCVVAGAKGDIGKPSMVDKVANMVTSFAQKKNRAVVLIGHLQKLGDYGGTEQLLHLVDGLLRLDVKFVEDAQGRLTRDIKAREISWDGKSRQSESNTTAIVELTPQGIRPPSIKVLRELSRLHLVGP